MTLSDWSAIAGIFSGAGVAISVIYLSLQVRQAERSQRALMQQGRATRAADHAFILAQPDFAGLFNKGARAPQEMSIEEIDRYMLVCRAALLAAEDSVLHYRAGQLSEEAYAGFVAGARGMVGRSAGLRAAWRLTGMNYSPALRALMDDAVSTAKPVSAAELQAAWVKACEEG